MDEPQIAEVPARGENRDIGICVVIAAMNAEDTIGEAVMSALSQCEVQEVMVVDDASTDDTAKAAETAASGDPRLRVLRLDQNRGPAAARNLAIAQSTAPFIAVLDADDVFLEGRFRSLLVETDWDLIADNIVFVAEAAWKGLAVPPRSRSTERSSAVGLTEFVRGNLSRNGRQRGELGFVKPIVRREFLERHGLTYDPRLRLGEDYDLYVRALAKDARFRITASVGYAARVRAGSLSGRHGTSDLSALLDASDRHFAMVVTDHDGKQALHKLRGQLRARYLLRAFLDEKSDSGLAAAMAFALTPPANLLPILKGVLSDKLAALRQNPRPEPVLHYLLPLPAKGKIKALS